MSGFRQRYLRILRHRSITAGAIVIAALVGLSIYAVIGLPYHDAIRFWRGEGGIWTF